MKINNQYCTMMEDVLRTDKMFGVVMSDGKGQFCDVGTAVENIKQEIYRGDATSFPSMITINAVISLKSILTFFIHLFCYFCRRQSKTGKCVPATV